MNLPTLNDPRFIVTAEDDDGYPMMTVEFRRESRPPLYACWKFMTPKPSNDDIASVVFERVGVLLEADAKEAGEIS